VQVSVLLVVVWIKVNLREHLRFRVLITSGINELDYTVLV